MFIDIEPKINQIFKLFAVKRQVIKTDFFVIKNQFKHFLRPIYQRKKYLLKPIC